MSQPFPLAQQSSDFLQTVKEAAATMRSLAGPEVSAALDEFTAEAVAAQNRWADATSAFAKILADTAASFRSSLAQLAEAVEAVSAPPAAVVPAAPVAAEQPAPEQPAPEDDDQAEVEPEYGGEARFDTVFGETVELPPIGAEVQAEAASTATLHRPGTNGRKRKR